MAWDYTEKEYRKQADADEVWRLERLINDGLKGEKLDRKMLARNLVRLRIPEDRLGVFEMRL